MRTVFLAALALISALLASGQVLKRCSAPREQPHTRLEEKFRRPSFSSGNVVHFSCAEGFVPSGGSASVQCLGGTWTELTLKCDKEATACSPPVVAHSVGAGESVSVYRVGDNVTFTCSQGFQLDGAPQVTCGPGGRWQPGLPRCLPTGRAPHTDGACGKPLTATNSNAILADKSTTTTFASGERVQYKCDIGHVQAGGSRYRTCKNGKWTPLFLKCEPKQCGSAGEILNGEFTYTGSEFGDTATAVCNEGYSLVGRATRNCLSNGWDGRVPDCEVLVCEEAPEETNAQKEVFTEPPFTYRTVIQYQCPTGTLVGEREIWCTADGTWSAPPPQCKVMTCPPPKVPRAFWRGTKNNLYQYRDTISIACVQGYAIKGPRTVTCGPDGRWSPDLPKCTRKWRQRSSGRPVVY